MKKCLKGQKIFLAGIMCCAALLQPILLRADSHILVGEQETPAGGGVRVSPVPDISFYFPQVSLAGITTVTRELSTEQFPNLDFGSPAYVYRVSTTAQVSGPITVCVSFDMARFVVPNGEVRLWQLDGEEAFPITHTYGWTYACGNTGHLSSFAAAQNFGVAPITFSNANNSRTAFSFLESGGAISSASAQASQVSSDPHAARVQFFSASGTAVLTIVNGATPATGARVLLNGTIVGSGSLFKKYQNDLFAPVSLIPGTNTLDVYVDGGPGSSFTLSIQRAR